MSLEWYHWLVVASLKACVVLPAVLLAVWASRRTASAVLGLLLMTALLASPWLPVLNRLTPGIPVTLPALEWTGAFAREVPELAADTGVRELALEASRAEPEIEEWTWPERMMALWFLGAAGMFLSRMGRSMLERLRFANVRLAGEEDPLTGELSALCEIAGLRMRPWLVYHDAIEAPQTVGVLHPMIIVPERFSGWTQSEREMMFLHELAHIQRGDIANRWLMELVLAFFWFHPLVWVALRSYDLQVEKACDDAVIRAGHAPAAFGEVLLASAKGGKGVSKRMLRARLRSLLRAGKSRARLAWPMVLKFGTLYGLMMLPFGLLSFTPYPPGPAYQVFEGEEKLAALWRMRLGRGSVVADSSGNDCHGSVIGAEWAMDAERGVCLSFDGKRDRLVLAAPDVEWTGGACTLALWLKPAPDSDGGGLLLRGDLNDAWCSALTSRQGVRARMSERELFLSAAFDRHGIMGEEGGLHPSFNYCQISAGYANKELPSGTWSHLAVVWEKSEASGARFRIYLNAELLDIQYVHPLVGPREYDWKTNVWHFGIGESPTIIGNNYEGLVSDLAVYRAALGPDELRAVMRGEFGTPKANSK